MKINYYIGATLFCTCEENSLMDLAIKETQKRERAKATAQILKHLRFSDVSITPKRNISKDILLKVFAS